MRGVSSGDGRDAALSRQQPIRPAGTHRPRPSGMLPYIARGVAASAVAGRAAACLAAAAATILIGASAAPASAPAGGWSITPSPNSRVPTGQLFWVSCPTAHSCMAVGTYVKASGIGVNLAEQWNGTSWRILPIPNPPGMAVSGLLGVACASSSACMAVGASTTTAGAARTLAERWDGTRWTVQTTPHSPPGGFLNARVLHVGLSVHRRRKLCRRDPRRTVERHPVDHPAHPQPVPGRRWPERGVMHLSGGLHRGRRLERRGPRRAVERYPLEHPVHT